MSRTSSWASGLAAVVLGACLVVESAKNRAAFSSASSFASVQASVATSCENRWYWLAQRDRYSSLSEGLYSAVPLIRYTHALDSSRVLSAHRAPNYDLRCA